MALCVRAVGKDCTILTDSSDTKLKDTSKGLPRMPLQRHGHQKILSKTAEPWPSGLVKLFPQQQRASLESGQPVDHSLLQHHQLWGISFVLNSGVSAWYQFETEIATQGADCYSGACLW